MSTYCLTSGATWRPRKWKTEERMLMRETDSPRGYTKNAEKMKLKKDLGQYFVALLCVR